jgi:hypothetical protein
VSTRGDPLSNAIATYNAGCIQLFGRKINFIDSEIKGGHTAVAVGIAVRENAILREARKINELTRELNNINRRIARMSNLGRSGDDMFQLQERRMGLTEELGEILAQRQERDQALQRAVRDPSART